MPTMIKRPCSQPGCPGSAVPGGRCALHKRSVVRRYDEQRGTPAERGYDYAWRKRREKYLGDNPWCVKCGRLANTVDHIVPLARGGADDESNWQSMCLSDHSRKTTTQDNRFGRAIQ